MTGVPSLPHLVRAEVIKLSTRTPVRLAVAVLLVVALFGPLALLFVDKVMVVSTEAAQAGVEAPTFDLGAALQSVLAIKDFFLFRAFVIAVVALSTAGELAAKTLREDLTRPVAREIVLLAKWCALQVFVLVGTLVPLIVASLVGLACFGVGEESLADPMASWALSCLGDVGFTTLVVMIALLVRSVTGTVGGVFLFWILDWSLGVALWAVENGQAVIEQMLKAYGMTDLEWVVTALIAARPWLPSAAFAPVWDAAPDAEQAWQRFVALGLYTLGAIVVSVLWFRSIDVD